LDTIAHEFRHSKYPERPEIEILNGDETPLLDISYPMLMQKLWEKYNQ